MNLSIGASLLAVAKSIYYTRNFLKTIKFQWTKRLASAKKFTNVHLPLRGKVGYFRKNTLKKPLLSS